MTHATPRKIGKFTVIRVLGEGATSKVYLADDPFNARKVAIKVMQRDPGASSEQQRLSQSAFLTEAALAGRLHHPHIAAIHDAVVDGDSSYVVMEYADGGTLEKYCRFDNLLPIDRVVEYMFMACLALDHAHHGGVIHCDIKPANLLLAGDDQLKISDFGAARYVAAAHTQLSGVGSPLYMSPEQIEDKQLNLQTDIYSLGAVMYQLLALRTPFRAKSHASLLNQITRVDLLPPPIDRPGLPPDLNRIVMRALAKNREDRYPEWREFASDLENLFGHLHLPEQDQSEAERFGVLRQMPLFQSFGDVEIWETLRVGTWHQLRAGATLIREGEACTGFFIIVAGNIIVSRDGQALDTLAEGQFFGDVLYFEDSAAPRTTTMTSASPVVLLEIKAEALRAATAACKVRFDHALLRILVNRMEQSPLDGSGER